MIIFEISIGSRKYATTDVAQIITNYERMVWLKTTKIIDNIDKNCI